MTEQDSAVIGAIFLTTLITSLFWCCIWALITIERLRKEYAEDDE